MLAQAGVFKEAPSILLRLEHATRSRRRENVSRIPSYENNTIGKDCVGVASQVVAGGQQG